MCAAAPGSALGADKAATCATLQAVLDGAADGDVITLDSSAGPGGLCADEYNLPAFPAPVGIENYKSVTLKGNPVNGQDGFDGTGLSDRILTGVDTHRFEIHDLLFRDGSKTGNGGAIDISGRSSLAVRFSKFLNNRATGNGGAIHFTQAFGAEIPIPISLGIQESEFGSLTDPTQGNRADGDGGAISVEAPGVGSNSGINGSLLANNTAGGNGGGFDWAITDDDNLNLDNNSVVANQAAGSGGGGRVKIGNATLLQIRANRFEGNAVQPIAGAPAPPLSDHFGGGLFVDNGGSSIFQDRNVFAGNDVRAFATDRDLGGGGQAVINTGGGTTNSELDRFTHNTVAGQDAASAFESEGGGVYFSGAGATLRGRLAAVAGNAVGSNGSGGGIYVGSAVAGTTLELNDSTVAGNRVGSGGAAPGLAGGGDDQLKLRNSIVWNLAKPDIDGFATTDIQFSLACLGTSTVPPGGGNICADPLLADAAGGNVHQTATSPTVDKGNDAAFFEVAGEGPFTDFEGDPRPTDGDGDGHTTDMGADEGPAFVRPVVPVIPGPVTASGAKTQCADAKDNDGDGAVDGQDPGCASAADTNEGDESVRDLVLCGRRTISLVRADLRGGRVRLSGLVAAKVAKRPVTILANYGKAKGSAFTRRATVRPNSRGQFSATLPAPPKKFFARARFQARVGASRSAALKLPQSLASGSIRKSGTSIVIRGRIDRAVLGKRNPVVIQRIVCGRYRTVGSSKPDARGRYVVRFRAPALGTAALYRAQGRVLARPGSKRYVRQFARALGITLTGETG